MSRQPMLGARCPHEWHEQIQAIASAAGRSEAQVVREAIAQYLGKTDPASLKVGLADLQDRVVTLEQKLAGLGRLVG